MYVFVLPVSGGGFVVQLAIIQHLCEAKIIPDVILSSSGGNVAAYVATAADWKWSGIERISQDLSQNLFLKSWSFINPLSVIIGYFKGSVYDKGTGVYDFISRYFNSSNIAKYEIWTGTYNKNHQKARLFCNRAKDANGKTERTIFDTSCINYELTQSLEPIFADGDIDLIVQAGVASISIPGIVPAQRILGDNYIDGGVFCASPLTVMKEPILKYIKDTSEPLHIIYINSVDLSLCNTKKIHNVLDTWKEVTHDLIRSQIVIDRKIGYEIIREQSSKDLIKKEFTCNYENLDLIKNLPSKYSLLEFYPSGSENFDVDITRFSGKDIITSIHKAYNSCSCRLWSV